MDGQGKVLESLRRVKVVLLDRLVVWGGGDEEEDGTGKRGRRGDPCRRGGAKGEGRKGPTYDVVPTTLG